VEEVSLLKKIQIFKALDIEIKKQKGPSAVKHPYKDHKSLKEVLSQKGISIIAEIAGGNPMYGRVRQAFRPSTHARTLLENGAHALSVATDRFLYAGSDKHLTEARSVAGCPLIRRDFIFEEYQVEESKILGADAISLTPALLEPERLQALHSMATSKNLDVIVEVTSQSDLDFATEIQAQIICVVGRDLDSWEVSWDETIKLLQKIPQKQCLRMVEAGVASLKQLKELEAMGVHGAIICDILLPEFYPGKRLAQLLAGVEPPKKSTKKKSKAADDAPKATPAKTAVPAARVVSDKDTKSVKPVATTSKSAKPAVVAKDVKSSKSTKPVAVTSKSAKPAAVAKAVKPSKPAKPAAAAKKPTKSVVTAKSTKLTKAAKKKDTKSAKSSKATKVTKAPNKATKTPVAKSAGGAKGKMSVTQKSSPSSKHPLKGIKETSMVLTKKATTAASPGKKPAVKKAATTKSAAPKKAAAKPAAKKVAPVKKTAIKSSKPAVKKPAPKKAAPAKAATKATKPALKKPVAKKAAPKTASKAVAKKPVAKKPATKAPVKKVVKTAAKPASASKKPVAKKVTKPVIKKAAAPKKPAPKATTARKPCKPSGKTAVKK
jgi:indole-3-glycerol phosphate synthase